MATANQQLGVGDRLRRSTAWLVMASVGALGAGACTSERTATPGPGTTIAATDPANNPGRNQVEATQAAPVWPQIENNDDRKKAISDALGADLDTVYKSLAPSKNQEGWWEAAFYDGPSLEGSQKAVIISISDRINKFGDDELNYEQFRASGVRKELWKEDLGGTTTAAYLDTQTGQATVYGVNAVIRIDYHQILPSDQTDSGYAHFPMPWTGADLNQAPAALIAEQFKK